MATGTASTRYSTVAIILHWLIAALLIFQVGLGLRMEAVSGAAKFAAFQLHKSVGITLLLLVALRLVWRFYRTPPPVAATGWERVLAVAVHTLFYLLLFALPISGWLIVSTSKIEVPTLLYGAIPWPNLPIAAAAKEAWHNAGEFIHVNLVTILYGLFALHVAGALKHHFFDRDGDIGRMAPGVKAGKADPRLIAIGLGAVAAAGLGLQWLPIGATKAAAPPKVAIQETAPQPLAEAPPVAESEEEPIENETAPVEETLSSWSIASGSSLRFRTSWSGQAIDGGFSRFDGTIDFSPELLDQSRVEIRIETGSADSGDSQRDETLKSGDWFATGAHGTAVFKASRFRKTGAKSFVANGTLRLKGVTLPVSLPFTLIIDGDRATMQGSATIDRTAFKIGDASTAEIPASVRVDVRVNARKKP